MEQTKTQVTVVGNGHSLLDAPRGNLIDNSDIIIRFNNFRIEGYELYTGKKTTWWYGYMQPHPRLREFSKVFLSLYPARIEKALQKRAQLIKDACNEHEIPFELINEADASLSNLYPKLGMNKKSGPKPTGGLIMIQKLIDNYDHQIQIAGFDHYKSGYEHYWDDEPMGKGHNSSRAHDPITEQAYLQQLERQGKITIL